MFNIKWGAVSAGAAFVLALALSLILGQTNLLHALLRGLVFAGLFFGLGMATWSLIKAFIPDLLSPSGMKGDIAASLFSPGTTGSRVDITVDDVQNPALPEQENGTSADVGEFNELFFNKSASTEDNQDIDQISPTVYTEGEETEPFAAGTDEFASAFNDDNLREEEGTGGFSMDFSAFIPGGLGGDNAAEESESSEDLDSDLDSFSFFSDSPGGGSTKSEESTVPERRVSRNKPMKLEGDFNAKEIAAGLRTVLEKDKK